MVDTLKIFSEQGNIKTLKFRDQNTSAYTQTYSTASKTVPAATQSTPPAGGTGATAGAYDSAANRDLMIASITAAAADILALKKVVTAIIDDLQALELIT